MGMNPPVNGYDKSCNPLIFPGFLPTKIFKLLKLLKRRQDALLVCSRRRYFQHRNRGQKQGNLLCSAESQESSDLASGDGWDRQDDMVIDHLLVQHLAHRTHPVVYADFGTPPDERS
jgi:hypothetical protein